MTAIVANQGSVQMRRLVHAGARIGGLVAGLAIGQGSLLVVQTWLVSAGQLDGVASFGFAVAILSLVQWAADWGGLVLLSRHAAAGGDFLGVWAACIGRLLLSVAICGLLLVFAFHYRDVDAFAAGILCGGIGIAPIWALNLSGVLDGLGKSAHSGPLAGLPWLFASTTIAAIFSFGHFSFDTGVLIGAAYGFGCAICVVLQFRIAAAANQLQSLRKVARSDVRHYVAQGALYCVAELPKELYGRALILVVTTALAAQTAGVYIYVRQLLSGCAQIIGVIKRVEFLTLTRAVAQSPLSLRRIVQAQSINLGATLLCLVGALILFAAKEVLPAQFASIAYYLLLFVATLPFWALAVAFGQVLIIAQRLRTYTAVTLIGLAIGAAVTLTLTPHFGIASIAVVDIALNLVQILVFYRIAKGAEGWRSRIT